LIIGVVIGQKGRDIPKDKAFNYVGGYALALDLTARLECPCGCGVHLSTLGTFNPSLKTKDCRGHRGIIIHVQNVS
jgi:hypothetical protein